MPLREQLSLGFNPTLVRLRPSIETNRWVGDAEFQSHAGSIEARGKRQQSCYENSFNPTLVRLRPVSLDEWKRAMTRFNPTLVRLRPWAELRRILS